MCRTLQSPDLNSSLVGIGVKVIGSSPEQFGKFMDAEIAKWSRVIRTAGVKLNQ